MSERYLSDLLREAPKPHRRRPLIYRWWWVPPVAVFAAGAAYSFVCDHAYARALTLVAVCVGIRWAAKKLEEM